MTFPALTGRQTQVLSFQWKLQGCVINVVTGRVYILPFLRNPQESGHWIAAQLNNKAFISGYVHEDHFIAVANIPSFSFFSISCWCGQISGEMRAHLIISAASFRMFL